MQITYTRNSSVRPSEALTTKSTSSQKLSEGMVCRLQTSSRILLCDSIRLVGNASNKMFTSLLKPRCTMR